MVGSRLIVTSRASTLAVAQVEEALPIIRSVLPDNPTIERVTRPTPGDRDLNTSLTDPSVAPDFFTRDLDLMLVRGEADLAIHSAKDLPDPLPEGIAIAALLAAQDIRDALVIRAGLTTDNIRVVGSSSPKRNEELVRLHPDWKLKPIRGAIGARLEQLDAGRYDAVIVAACALERLGLQSRIASYMPWDPTPNQGRLAVTVRSDRQDLLSALRQLDIRRNAGLVVLLGCPADISLISHRALQYLHHADVVVHDRLIPDEILSIIGDKSVPVGKTGGAPSTPQFDIHRQMLHFAEQGKLVVRLHGGDPGIYGRLNEELEFLSAWQLRTDIVPSVTAAQVAAAHAGAPLTHRGEGHRLTLISGSPPPGIPAPEVPGPDVGNLAVYMGVGAAADLQKKFYLAGWKSDAPVVIGEQLGKASEQIRHIALDQLAGTDIQSPAVFIVGAKSHPVSDRLLFTGTDPEHFLKYGPLLHWPMIELKALPLDLRVARLKEHLDGLSGFIFPSRYAVKTTVEALMELGDVRLLNGKRLLAVGPSTREELASFGLRADAAASNLGGIESLVGHLDPGERGNYFYPCSNESPKSARAARMKELGVELITTEFYRNQPTSKQPLPRLPFRRVLFTSSSTVETYFGRYPDEIKAQREWIAVGPSTLKTLQEKNIHARLL